MATTYDPATNPHTLDEWWAYIKTDLPGKKVRYFLRNYGGMGFGLAAILDYLRGLDGVEVTQHKQYTTNPVVGNYSIVTQDDAIIFRIDPTTPGIRGPLPYPSVCICF